MNFFLRFYYISILMVLLSGCRVTPDPLPFKKGAIESEKSLNDAIKHSQEPLIKPISIYEAMARAVKYNLDKQIELMEESTKLAQLDVKQYDMMPPLTIYSGYSRRNNYSGGRSQSLLTGRQSLEPSTSQDLGILTSDITLSWDILDFGVSYARAKQIGDEVMIAKERTRKVINRIMEDVRTAYWRAVSGERILAKLVTLESQAVQALRDSAEMEKRRIVSPGLLLNYQRDMLDVLTEAQRLQRELSLSKTQLAALMNVTPDTPFEIALPDRSDTIPVLPGSVDEMLLTALAYRPELREIQLKQRVVKQEKKIAQLQSLPSLKALLGLNYDSNNLTYNNDWLSFSSRLSFNLINIFRYPAQKKLIASQQNALEKQNLAMSMAIMTQVYISRERFIKFSHELGVAKKSYLVQTKLLDLARSSYKARAISRQMMLREEMKTLISEIKFDIAYADMQNSFAGMYSSMGLDTFSEEVDLNMDLNQIAEQLRAHWQENATNLPEIER